MNNIIKPAMKKREVAITKGCADSNPILVATEADDHKTAKAIPAATNFHSGDLPGDAIFLLVLD